MRRRPPDPDVREALAGMGYFPSKEVALATGVDVGTLRYWVNTARVRNLTIQGCMFVFVMDCVDYARGLPARRARMRRTLGRRANNGLRNA